MLSVVARLKDWAALALVVGVCVIVALLGLSLVVGAIGVFWGGVLGVVIGVARLVMKVLGVGW